MRSSSLNWKEYQPLERITALPSNRKSRWQVWGQHCLDWLTGDRDSIHIHSTQVEGQAFYDAHDRETNRRLHHASEAELRQWLEQRYRF